MTWTIYLLSILNNTSAIEAMAFICFFCSVILLPFLCGLNSAPDDYHDQEKRYQFLIRCIKISKNTAIVSAVIVTIGVLIPSREGIMRSYLMVEGAKIANAKTSKEAADAILKRVDRFIEAIEKTDK